MNVQCQRTLKDFNTCLNTIKCQYKTRNLYTSILKLYPQFTYTKERLLCVPKCWYFNNVLKPLRWTVTSQSGFLSTSHAFPSKQVPYKRHFNIPQNLICIYWFMLGLERNKHFHYFSTAGVHVPFCVLNNGYKSKKKNSAYFMQSSRGNQPLLFDVVGLADLHFHIT